MASRLHAHVKKKYTLPKIRYLKVETTILEVKNEIYVNFYPSETFIEFVPPESELLKFIFEFSIKNYPTLFKDHYFHRHIRKLWNLQKRQKCVVKLVQLWLGALNEQQEIGKLKGFISSREVRT